MTSLTVDFNTYSSLSGDTAISEEAKFLFQVKADSVECVERSQALFGEKSEAIQQIWEIYNECYTNNWDGYGGAPIPLSAAERAVEIIRILPGGIPLPECSPEPDGAISLDWNPARNKIFSISVGDDDRLPYAWLDDGERGHAVATFNSESIPTRVIGGIKEIIDSEDTGFRIISRYRP